MKPMTLRSAMTVGCIFLGVGCGVPESDMGLDEQPVQQAEQMLTTVTKTVSWPAITANKNCRFGDTAAGNQAPRNSYASGRLEQPLTVTGLAGQRIVSLTLRTPGGTSSAFKYDDVMLINYNKTVLVASDRRAADYSAGTGSGTTGTTPVTYVWSNILNKDIANERAQAAWCSTGASSCSVPKTQTSGTIDVRIPDFKGEDLLNYPTAPDARTFTLVTIGDNDDGTFNSGTQTSDTDCVHGEVKLELVITTEPAPPPVSGEYFEIDISQLTALQSDCTSAESNSIRGYSKHCIAAAHRFCRNKGYEAGSISEMLLPTVGVDCFRATDYSAVPMADLTAQHSGCNATSAYASLEYPYECAAAASRYCRARGFGSGLLQEILLPGTWVSCVPGAPKSDYRVAVPFSTWSKYHVDCPTAPAGVDTSKVCRAAARRYCRATSGVSTGLVAEWGGSVQDIVCINR